MPQAAQQSQGMVAKQGTAIERIESPRKRRNQKQKMQEFDLRFLICSSEKANLLMPKCMTDPAEAVTVAGEAFLPVC